MDLRASINDDTLLELRKASIIIGHFCWMVFSDDFSKIKWYTLRVSYVNLGTKSIHGLLLCKAFQTEGVKMYLWHHFVNGSNFYLKFSFQKWISGVWLYFISDQHFYIQLDNKATFQHIDITITTIRSNKPYKFGKLLRR